MNSKAIRKLGDVAALSPLIHCLGDEADVWRFFVCAQNGLRFHCEQVRLEPQCRREALNRRRELAHKLKSGFWDVLIFDDISACTAFCAERWPSPETRALADATPGCRRVSRYRRAAVVGASQPLRFVACSLSCVPDPNRSETTHARRP